MKIFDFDPQHYADSYRELGYVHVPGGAQADFVQHALRFTAERLAAPIDPELRDWQFNGKKRQFLMDFGEGMDFAGDLYAPIAAVAGLDVGRMMMGERHVKVYETTAQAAPPPHKDRLASQCTVGIALRVPEDSRLALFPAADLSVNPYVSSAEWRSTRDPRDLPERAVDGVEPVLLDTRPGDVVMFAGNTIYHERLNPASAQLLFMKFNDMRLDPLAEDPRTLALRERSLELLGARSDRELLALRVEVSPRLERVSRHYTRLHWQEVIHGRIQGENDFVLSETEFRALRAIGEGNATLRETIIRLGVSPLRAGELVPMFRRLVEVGAIELLG